MADNKKLSMTYKLMRAFGYNYSEEEYGQVSLFRVVKQFFLNIYRKHLVNTMDYAIYEPFNTRKRRARIMKKLGCHMGKNVYVGDHVAIDFNHAEMIFIDDYAHITDCCRLLCHQRNLKNYKKGDNAADLPYRTGEIHIGKGVMLGMETMVMPGVTIGDGAIVGARSLVVKDIPAWTVAVGSPAVVIKEIPERERIITPKE